MIPLATQHAKVLATVAREIQVMSPTKRYATGKSAEGSSRDSVNEANNNGTVLDPTAREENNVGAVVDDFTGENTT